MPMHGLCSGRQTLAVCVIPNHRDSPHVCLANLSPPPLPPPVFVCMQPAGSVAFTDWSNSGEGFRADFAYQQALAALTVPVRAALAPPQQTGSRQARVSRV